MCIFFLTFNSKHLIKGTQPRSLTSGANSGVKGESIDEERNQEESARKEKGCSEEKEVVTEVSSSTQGPEKSGPFLFQRPEKSGPFLFQRTGRSAGC
jgi:hypothetical protein